MTILGALLVDPESALVWADSEIYLGGQSPAYFRPKLVVNPLLCAAGCGTGLSVFVEAADAAVRTAADFDALPDAIRDALRLALQVDGSAFDRSRGEVCGLSYVVAGWSGSAGRMLAWEFEIDRYFVPRLTTRTTLPPRDLGIYWAPRGQDELVELARCQMAELRDSGLRGAGPGAHLSIAHLTKGRAAISSIPNFDADAAPEFFTTELELTE